MALSSISCGSTPIFPLCSQRQEPIIFRGSSLGFPAKTESLRTWKEKKKGVSICRVYHVGCEKSRKDVAEIIDNDELDKDNDNDEIQREEEYVLESSEEQSRKAPDDYNRRAHLFTSVSSHFNNQYHHGEPIDENQSD